MKGWLLLVAAFLLCPSCSSPNEITCNPPRISNGSFRPQRAIYQDGDLIRIHCDPGYDFEPHNAEKVVECTRNGWSPSPKCVEITCNPPGISNGSFRPQRTIYQDGDLIRIQCDHGFNFEPDNAEKVVECTRNGWSPSPKCVAVQSTCKKVSLLHGFFVQRQQSFQLNEKARYNCHDDYVTPEGKSEGETWCLAEGWNPEPKCIKMCSKPLADAVILNTTKSVFLSGDELHYECKEGLETIKNTIGDTIVCREKGWEPTPGCLPIECEPPVLDNVRIDPRLDKFQHKMVVHFKCLRGFTRVGPESSQCYHFGWSPQPPICKENVQTCQAPPSILHGMVIGELKQVYQHGDTLEVQCDISFAPYGSKFIECVDGEWAPLPSCTEEVKTCGPPPEITKGIALSFKSSSTYQHGETVEYLCQPRSAIFGTNPAKCLHGQWEVPSCLVNPRKCRRPWNTIFEPAVLLSKQFKTNSSATYRCGANLHETKCVDGLWVPEPLCKETCPPPPQLPNAINIAEMRIYRSGEEISFRCEEHFRLHGPQKIKCEDGKWQTPPRCLDLGETCGRPPPLDNGDILEIAKVQYLSGESVTYQCQSYHRMEGSPKVTCENGHWMEKPRCIVPCTASEEDMIYHNIQLRWRQSAKLYIANGDAAEFQCKGGYQPHPNSRPFRVTCTEGKFQYPHCTKV